MTYVPGSSVVHRCDARVKIGLLFVYSVAILAVPGWWGMGVLVFALTVVLALSKLPFGTVNRSLLPAYCLAAFSLVFNIAYDPGLGGLSTGLYVGVRMVALVAASVIVCFTTTSSELLDAFTAMIGPLGRLHVPVRDVAFTLALSVRFIPVIEAEFTRVRMAQRARGSDGVESVFRTLAIMGAAFASLFIGLFRHADNLAVAMDARCYGADRLNRSEGSSLCDETG